MELKSESLNVLELNEFLNMNFNNFQYKAVQEDIYFFIENEGIKDLSDIKIKLGFDKKENLMCMFCDFKNQTICEIKLLDIYIFYGSYVESYSQYNNILFMQVRPEKLYYRGGFGLELVSIEERYKEKRLGHGTFALKCIEDTIIPELNTRIADYNKYSKGSADFCRINRINGISGQIGDTSEEERQSFYESNGFELSGDYFEKHLP